MLDDTVIPILIVFSDDGREACEESQGLGIIILSFRVCPCSRLPHTNEPQDLPDPLALTFRTNSACPRLFAPNRTARPSGERQLSQQSAASKRLPPQ